MGGFAPDPQDIQRLAEQLGRVPRGVVEISARCACGAPAVIKTLPRLAGGEPFPTLYYLTLPAATAAISRLEATGFMAEAAATLEQDPELSRRYAAAHRRYIAEREALEAVAELAGISAGGMPNRVKCLHALAAHSLTGADNPVGEMALAAADWSLAHCECQRR